MKIYIYYFSHKTGVANALQVVRSKSTENFDDVAVETPDLPFRNFMQQTMLDERLLQQLRVN